MMVERRVLEVASGSAFLVHPYLAFQTTNHLFLGLEYASGGDFFKFLQRKGCLDITSAAFYAAEITCGVQYLHSKGIIHRDLKPDNILVAESGHLKIADFGLSIVNMFGERTATECVGTPGFIAPEMLAGEEYNAGVDWFSFGVIIKEMITGTSGYNRRRAKIPGDVAKDIINKLLCKNPSQRLGVNGNIRQHQFFMHIDWVSLEALRVAPPHVPGPPTIRTSSGVFNIDHIEREEARRSPIRAEDQELFAGFSYISPKWRTFP
ncbi:protein kinase C delta type-like [Mixophyes fleayi]|uniref:protein kinase C delta type-like n=1 Tax=Mixophyes fleayi TaxID=3061075 RepID=UPI003F4E0A7F